MVFRVVRLFFFILGFSGNVEVYGSFGISYGVYYILIVSYFNVVIDKILRITDVILLLFRIIMFFFYVWRGIILWDFKVIKDVDVFIYG